MSYILDALRKAERDRNLGRTPSLGDVTTPSARSSAQPARSLRPLLLLCLVVGLAILAVLVWPRRPVAPHPAVVAQVPAAVAAPVEATPAPESPAARVPATVEQGEPAVDESLEAESLDDLLEAGPEPELVAEQAETSPQESVVDAGVPAQGETEAVAPAPVESTAPPVQSASAPQAPAGVRLLREMPVDYRAAFQAVRIDVHVYDVDPAKRWALVNGKKVTEGVTLPEGPRVAEITPEGIVFDYRDERSLFPLNR